MFGYFACVQVCVQCVCLMPMNALAPVGGGVGGAELQEVVSHHVDSGN